MSLTYTLHDVVRSKNSSSYVTGNLRTNYHKQPLISIPSESTTYFLQETQAAVIREHEIISEPKTKDVEIQTMFRESEAQTDPYTPDYQILEGDKPEILKLAHLKYGAGLPASLDELVWIEKMREKQAFDWGLPPSSDEASFNIRRTLLNEQETKEWKDREAEIEAQQNEKLRLLKQALLQREREVEAGHAQRIEDIKLKKTEEKNRLVAKIQKKKIKVLRTLIKEKREDEEVGKDQKRDIIEEYHNFASRVYAGIAREGLSIDKLSAPFEVQPGLLSSFEGVSELAETISPKLLETKVNVEGLIRRIEGNYKKNEIFHKKDLQKAQEMISRTQRLKVRGKSLTSKTKEDIKFRAGTPENVPEYYEQIKTHTERVNIVKANFLRENAIIFLQRIIRGRGAQNNMYEGKEKRLALIDELLTVANVKQKNESEIEEELLQKHEERLKEAVIETIQGDVMMRAFDMLSKELVKFQQEKKISKLINVAENDRRKREAEEHGKRQAEENLLRRENQLYNEIMSTHQNTVDFLLGDLMNNVVDRAASREAYMIAQAKKEKVNDQIEILERKSNHSNAIIKDLVASFLIPNIQREKLQRKVQREERRFTETAKETLNLALAAGV